MSNCAKIGHESRAAAVGQKLGVKGKHGRVQQIKVYRCEHCKLWHIGRSKGKPGGRGGIHAHKPKFYGERQWRGFVSVNGRTRGFEDDGAE